MQNSSPLNWKITLSPEVNPTPDTPLPGAHREGDSVVWFESLTEAFRLRVELQAGDQESYLEGLRHFARLQFAGLSDLMFHANVRLTTDSDKNPLPASTQKEVPLWWFIFTAQTLLEKEKYGLSYDEPPANEAEK